MKARIWGTRGSLAVSGPQVMRYGGNTSCVEVRDGSGGLIVLDAGTGLQRLGDSVEPGIERLDLLLTHFHVDHLFGFGFFSVLFRPDVEVHIWGPASDHTNLRKRLNRYLSPPLFPVRLPDLPAQVHLHNVPLGTFDLPGVQVTADLISHPGRTVGYRLDDGDATVTYMPDHEPALGWTDFPHDHRWTSGHALAKDVDLLIHDAQYTDDEYLAKVGWGHSSVRQAVKFARMADARELVAFHHDPAHDDFDLDDMFERAREQVGDDLKFTAAREGSVYELGNVTA